MSDQSNQVRFARRWVIRRTGHPDIHGIQFPESKAVLYDQPGTGLTAATSIDHVIPDSPDLTVHWADEEMQ